MTWMLADTAVQAGGVALIKIALAFAVMVVLIRLGWAIGYVLLLSAVLLGFGFGVGFEPQGSGAEWIWTGTKNLGSILLAAAVELRGLRLLALVLLVTVFGIVLRRVEKLQALANALLALFRDRRWAMAWLASLIGLLPMPGGAMVSAPMVGEVAKDVDLSPEEKTAINHWMRHIWEYIDPLYPGLLMAAFYLHVSVGMLMLVQSPFCVVSIIAGVVFLLRLVPHHQRRVGDEAGRRSVGTVLSAVGPVLIVIAAAMLPPMVSFIVGRWPGAVHYLPGGAWWLDAQFVRDMPEWMMLAALLVLLPTLLIRNRVSRAESFKLIRQGVTLQMTALVIGINLMKAVLEGSGQLPSIAVYFQSLHLPVPVVIGAITFIVGMLLGYTYGYVAICYPVLLPMIGTGDTVNYPLAAFAFAFGFIGVLLSPVHLCLVLAREHFDARWGGVYWKLLAPSLAVLLAAAAMLLWA